MFLRHMLKTPVWESRTGADALGCQRLACSLLGDTNSVTLTNWLLNVSSWNTASKKQWTFHVCMRVKKSEEMEVLIICYKDWALNSRLVCSHRGRDGARPEQNLQWLPHPGWDFDRGQRLAWSYSVSTPTAQQLQESNITVGKLLRQLIKINTA